MLQSTEKKFKLSVQIIQADGTLIFDLPVQLMIIVKVYVRLARILKHLELQQKTNVKIVKLVRTQ